MLSQPQSVFSTVTVQKGPTISVDHKNAIGLGDNANITLEDSSVVTKKSNSNGNLLELLQHYRLASPIAPPPDIVAEPHCRPRKADLHEVVNVRCKVIVSARFYSRFDPTAVYLCNF
ncbi:MAG: hypothetical protein ACRECW_13410 [Phyllobacterium sp.]